MGKMSKLFVSLLGLTMLVGCDNPVTPPDPIGGGDVVVDNDVHVTGVSLNNSSLTINEGETFTLQATVAPENATKKDVTWATSDASVATVENGVVTAIKEGSAAITVTSVDGNKFAICLVTVSKVVVPPGEVVAVEGVKLTTKNLTLNEGEVSSALGYSVTPRNATNKSVTWQTSDPAVATVADGVVTGVTQGTASISVTTVDGKKTDYCMVVVKEKISVLTASVEDSKGLIKSNPQMEVDGTYVDIPKENNVYQIKYGSTVKFVLGANGDNEPTGLIVNGTVYAADGQGVVTFPGTVLEGASTNLNIIVQYTDKTEGAFSFAFEGDTYVDVKTLNSSFGEVNSANSGERIYISCEGKENYETYNCIGATVKYQNSDFGQYSTKDCYYDDNAGMYYFDVPYTNYGQKITISLQTKDSQLLRDTNIAGKYVCLWLTSATNKIDALQENILEISSKGKMSYIYNSASSFENEMMSINKENQTFTINAGYDNIPYGENFIFTSTVKSEQFSAPCHNYDLLCCKLALKNDNPKYYKVRGEKFKIGDHDYAVATFYKSSGGVNTDIASAFIDYDLSNESKIKVTPYYNVNVEMLVGDTPSDNQVMYKITSAEGEVIKMFTTKLNGGFKNRAICSGNEGVYLDENEKQLIVYGPNVAYYNDTKYRISFDGNNAKLEQIGETINVAFDFENGTYEITSQTETGLTIPTFNYTLVSQDSAWRLVLNDSDGVITGTLYEHYNQSTQQAFFFNAEFDVVTNVLTLNIYNKSFYDSYVKEIHVQCEKGKMTFMEDIDSGWYHTKDVVVSNTAFNL